MENAIVCPWCGTQYLEFQSNCRNCGGTLPAPRRTPAPPAQTPRQARLAWPPPAPRTVAPNYVWKLLREDAWVVAMLVFVLIGAIFTMTGFGLTLGIVTAFVGLPFLGLGLLFLGGGGAVLYWRYQEALQTVAILQSGEAIEGEIIGLEPNYSVRVNGRMPWTISYQFVLDGQSFYGTASTLNDPQSTHAPGPAVVLYLPERPEKHQLYPHP